MLIVMPKVPCRKRFFKRQKYRKNKSLNESKNTVVCGPSVINVASKSCSLYDVTHEKHFPYFAIEHDHCYSASKPTANHSDHSSTSSYIFINVDSLSSGTRETQYPVVEDVQHSSFFSSYSENSDDESANKTVSCLERTMNTDICDVSIDVKGDSSTSVTLETVYLSTPSPVSNEQDMPLNPLMCCTDPEEVNNTSCSNVARLCKSGGSFLCQVKDSLTLMLPSQWLVVVRDVGLHIGLMADFQHLTTQRSLFFASNGEVSAAVHGKSLPECHDFWNNVTLVPLVEENLGRFCDNIVSIVNKFQGLVICKGVEKYDSLWSKAPNSFIDLNSFQEHRYLKTCRAYDCLLLVSGFKYKRCQVCVRLCDTLRHRHKSKLVQSPQTPSSKKPHTSLSTPEKDLILKQNAKERKNLRQQNKRLRAKLKELLGREDMGTSTNLSHDFVSFLH